MKQRHVLGPVMAAVLAALAAGAAQAQYDTTWQRDVAVKDTTPLTREQVREELASARAGGWQGYGSEETIAPPQETAARTGAREDVVAELNEWRTAGTIETWDTEGSEDRIQVRRMALQQQQAQRYAAAQQAEQERLARERDAEAQRLAAQTAAPADPAAAPVVGGSGTADMTSTAPADNAGAPPAGTASAPVEPQPQSPPVGGPTDAAVDSTRGRSSSSGTADSLAATPQPVPEPAPSDVRPLDAATPGVAPADTSAPPLAAPADATSTAPETGSGAASPSAVPSPVTDTPPASQSSDLAPPAAADAPASPR